MATILAEECVKCTYGSYHNGAKKPIHCERKGKDYFYGQYIPCDLSRKDRNAKE